MSTILLSHLFGGTEAPLLLNTLQYAPLSPALLNNLRPLRFLHRIATISFESIEGTMTTGRLRILNRDELLGIEFLVRHQVEKVLRLLVQLLVSVVRVDIASFFNCDDVRTFGESLIGHWAMILSLFVLMEV